MRVFLSGSSAFLSTKKPPSLPLAYKLNAARKGCCPFFGSLTAIVGPSDLRRHQTAAVSPDEPFPALLIPEQKLVPGNADHYTRELSTVHQTVDLRGCTRKK
jgi:hypothetical protein